MKHLRIFKQEILRPSVEILSANSTTNAQNDMGVNNETNNVILNLFQDLVPTQYLKFKKAKKLDSRTQWFENDVVCHFESKAEESQSFANVVDNAQKLDFQDCCFEKDMVNSLAPCGRGLGRGVEQEQEILHPSAEVLSVNPTTNAQNDMRANVCTLTPAPSPVGRGVKKPVFTLAEGATHVDMFHDIRKSAFTLAEVLVTLGIIGVVAAMTLPMLAKNYQFFIRQQQFKKAYAALAIAVQKTQIDMGEGVRCYSLNDEGWTYVIDDCPRFYDELANNLQVIKYCPHGKAISGKCIPEDLKGGDEIYAKVQGADDPQAALDKFNNGCAAFGARELNRSARAYVVNPNFVIVPYGRSASNLNTYFFVDINGHQKPNKWGHDVFLFGLDKSNHYESVFKLIPTKRCHPVDVGGYYTRTFVEYLYGRNAEL